MRKLSPIAVTSAFSVLFCVGLARGEISPGEATFHYEGDSLPFTGSFPDDFSNVFTENYTATTLSETAAGGIYTAHITESGDTPEASVFYQTHNVTEFLNSTTFTIDWRVNRGLISAGVQSSTRYDPPQIDVFPEPQQRIDFKLGSRTDLNDADSLTIFDESGEHLVDNVAGLNIDVFNVFRVVGIGDGSYKVYLNANPTPIATGTLFSGVFSTDVRRGSVGMGFQTDNVSGDTDMAIQIDYLRVLAGSALDAPPLLTVPVPGDFDADGDVDGADFVAWQTHFPTAAGAMLADGDADGDGDVDGADFVVWQTNFPFTPSPSAAPIPEPKAACLLLLGGLLAFPLSRALRIRPTYASPIA